MDQRIWAFICEQGLIREGQNIGVAVSGGPDSMALLVCLRQLSDVYGFCISCIHFEHGIRGEQSLLDAEFVEQRCTEYGIPLYMGAADVPSLMQEWGMGIESAAKRAREAYMATLLEQGDVDAIATGHHMDDSAESVLMHLLRGSGSNGLVGIHARKGGYIRPFLCVSRRDIIQYIERNGIPYVVDETNLDTDNTRNYLRNMLIPEIQKHVNPDVVFALGRLSTLVSQDVEYIDQCAGRAYDRLAQAQDDVVRIDAQGLAGLHPALAGRVVRRACAALHVVQDIELSHVRAVIELAASGRTGARANLTRSLMAELEYGTLTLGFTGRKVDRTFEIPLALDTVNVLPDGSRITCTRVQEYDPQNTNAYRECFDADKLPVGLVIRTRHTGDVIRPIGGGGKKLKDYFIDNKMPRSQRESTPLIANGGDIVWVVGHVMGDAYKVDDTTQHILQIEYTAREGTVGALRRE